MVRLTGLWRGTTKDGGTYLSGSISPSSRLLIFANEEKGDGSKAPDYIVYIVPAEKKKRVKAEGAGL